MKNRFLLRIAATAVFILSLGGCATSPVHEDEAVTAPSHSADNQRLAQIRLQLAVGYYGQGQVETALEEINRALRAAPDFADAYSMRGLIYMDMKEDQLAEKSFLQALKLSPNAPDFNNNYGWFLCQSGRERESIDFFEAAIKNRTYRSPAKALNNAGVCSLKLNERDAAERYFSQAFKQEPGNISTNLSLARIYFEDRDNERARFYVQRVMKADVMTAEVLWLAIRIEHKLGNSAAVSSLGTQLRRRHGGSPEFAAYQRGAFDE